MGHSDFHVTFPGKDEGVYSMKVKGKVEGTAFAQREQHYECSETKG